MSHCLCEGGGSTPPGTANHHFGPVASMGRHPVCTREPEGSIPFRSTKGSLGEWVKPSPPQGEDSGFEALWSYHSARVAESWHTQQPEELLFWEFESPRAHHKCRGTARVAAESVKLQSGSHGGFEPHPRHQTSGCGPVVGHLLWEQAHARSNRVAPTNMRPSSNWQDGTLPASRCGIIPRRPLQHASVVQR